MLPTSLLAAQRRQRIENGSQSAEAYARIKEKILTLELAPASALDENALMAELGLGRTPVREAIQRLAHDSLVVVYPRRGTLVADLNMSDLQKVFELRLTLEPFAAELAAKRATLQQVENLEQLFTKSAKLLRKGNTHQLIQIDHEFHRLLAQAAHNEFLEETLERLYNQVLRLWYVSLHKVSRLREAVEEHREVVLAVKAHDAERAAHIMRAHITGFQSEFLAASQ